MLERELGKSVVQPDLDVSVDLGDAPIASGDSSRIAPRISSTPSKSRWLLYTILVFVIMALGALVSEEFRRSRQDADVLRSSRIPSQTRDSVIEQRGLEVARRSWNNKDYKAVVTQCTAILKQFPKSSRALLVRSSAFAMLSDWEHSIEDHLTLVVTDPALAAQKSTGIAVAYHHRAKQYISEGKKLVDSGHLHDAIDRLDAALNLANQGATLRDSKDPLCNEIRKYRDRCQRTLNLETGYPFELLKMRRWIDSTGKFSTTARIVEITDGRVRLERADGSRCSIDVSRISAQDKKLLRRPTSH